MTDSELLKLYKTNEQRAVRLTVEIYYAYVLKIVSGRLSDASPEDIEETVSDVFIRFWQDADKIDLSRGSIKAYISVLAQSIAANRYRQLARSRVLPLDEDIVPSEAPHSRSIVMMRYYYSMSHAEIAKVIGLKEPAVRKRLERALKKLRKETEGSF